MVIHTGDLSDNGSSAELLLAKKHLDNLSCRIMSHREQDCAEKLIEVFTEQLSDVVTSGPITYLVDGFSRQISLS